jgi:hypothetical protein
MFMWITVTLVAAAFLTAAWSALAKRSGGLVELGSVSTQWLAEQRQYSEGDRSR